MQPVAAGLTFKHSRHLCNISAHLRIYRMDHKDPVCNLKVDERNTQHVSEINGQKINLCFKQCKSYFDQNLSKYEY
jgi:YHS domain-containing protein